jgi:hypothetical protein
MIEGFAAPNWEDGTAYPNTNDAKPTRWAWEFLRRNKQYQLDWKEFADAVMEKAAKHPETLKFAKWYLTRNDETWAEFAGQFRGAAERDAALSKHGDTIFDWRDGPLIAFDPPLKNGETYEAYKQRVKGWMRTLLGDHLGRKWGVHTIWNPNSLKIGMPSGVHFNSWLGSGWSVPNVDFRGDLARFDANPIPYSTREEYAVRLVTDLGDRLGKPELETITFDLSLPIDVQVDWVRAHLKAHARIRSEAGEMKIVPQPRYEARMYRNYLRAFDAKRAGVKPADIVKVLLPKEAKKNGAADGYSVSAKVKAWTKQAEFLVETGYRFIPLAANKADKEKREKLRL